MTPLYDQLENSLHYPRKKRLGESKSPPKPFPDSTTMNFAIDARCGPFNKNLRDLFRTLGRGELAGFRIDRACDNAGWHHEGLSLGRDHPPRDVNPVRQSPLRTGKTDRTFIVESHPNT